MVARCAMAAGDTDAAGAAIAQASELQRSGAAALSSLVGEGEELVIPKVLELPELNLAEVFADRSLDVPGLSWQVQYLSATLNTKRGGKMDFDLLRGAAETLAGVLKGLDREEAVNYVRHASFGEKPEAQRLVEDLVKTARTADERQRAQELEAALSVVKEA